MLLCYFFNLLSDDGNDVGALRKFLYIRGDKVILLDREIVHVCVSFPCYNGMVVVRNIMGSPVKRKKYDCISMYLYIDYGIMPRNDDKCVCL